MTAVMAVSAVVLGATTSALLAIRRVDRDLSARHDARRAVEHLLDRLRRDVHAAEEFTWNPQESTLHLVIAQGKTIEYRERAHRWERRATPGADVAARSGKSQDGLPSLTAFRRPSTLSWSADARHGRTGDLLRIELRAAHHEHGEPFGAEIVATVGRDRRLLHE